MSNKFTEEQYQKIVAIYNKKSFIQDSVKGVIDYYVDNIGIMVNTNALMALAIANPLTREWAHEQYVEKEKKFVWNSKNPLNDGDFVRLYKESDGDIAYVIVDDNVSISSDELLTFKEVMNSIFDVNMFNKKEMK